MSPDLREELRALRAVAHNRRDLLLSGLEGNPHHPERDAAAAAWATAEVAATATLLRVMAENTDDAAEREDLRRGLRIQRRVADLERRMRVGRNG